MLKGEQERLHNANSKTDGDELEAYEVSYKWENKLAGQSSIGIRLSCSLFLCLIPSFHPYIFFNQTSGMTFVGFYIKERNGQYDAFDPAKPNVPIIENVVPPHLYRDLIRLHMGDTQLLEEDYTKCIR